MSDGKFKILDNQKKQVWMIAAAVVVGVSLLVVPSLISFNKQTSEVPKMANVDTAVASSQTSLEAWERAFESKLASMLSQIDGVGKASVSVTLDAGPEYTYAMNTNINKTTTEENAKDGGTRVSTELNEKNDLVIVQPGSNKNEPIIIKESSPSIKGVMVVAEGAKDMEVRSKISRAVQVLLDIHAHQVTVLPRVGE